MDMNIVIRPVLTADEIQKRLKIISLAVKNAKHIKSNLQ